MRKEIPRTAGPGDGQFGISFALRDGDGELHLHLPGAGNLKSLRKKPITGHSRLLPDGPYGIKRVEKDRALISATEAS